MPSRATTGTPMPIPIFAPMDRSPLLLGSGDPMPFVAPLVLDVTELVVPLVLDVTELVVLVAELVELVEVVEPLLGSVMLKVSLTATGLVFPS
jgi:hypothetical protein